MDFDLFGIGVADDTGLAFFYGGLVRGQSVLNTMMMSVIAMGIGVVLGGLGYSIAFGDGGLVRFV